VHCVHEWSGTCSCGGWAANTREAYVRAVVGLAKYYGRPPDTLSPDDVQGYLVHLIEERQLAWSSCSVAVHGLRFFYEVTLGRERRAYYIPTPKKPSRQPEILSREEVARLFASTANVKHRALLMTTYAAGGFASGVSHLARGRGVGRSDLNGGLRSLRPSIWVLLTLGALWPVSGAGGGDLPRPHCSKCRHPDPAPESSRRAATVPPFLPAWPVGTPEGRPAGPTAKAG
jgi:integrase-like protein